MKINFLTSIVLILCVFSLQAQKNKGKSKSRSVSVNVSNSNSSSSSSSISISSNNNTYKMSARFNKEKTEVVLDLLNFELGGKNLTTTKGLWESIKNNDIAYRVKLSQGRLKISVDKEVVSPRTIVMFEELSEEIFDLISYKSKDKKHKRKD